MRWDNAPHYKGLSDFPHHIHLSNETVKANSLIPNILMVLDEIERMVEK